MPRQINRAKLFQRRHYEEMARIIRVMDGFDYATKDKVAKHFSRELQGTNSTPYPTYNYDRQRFYNACMEDTVFMDWCQCNT